nr:glutamate-5-semialdehyde dehydrogenase [Dehalococcoidia bacterium]
MTTIAPSEAITKAAAAKAAGRRLAYASTDQKNEALHRIADALLADQAHLLEVNAGDVQRGQERGLSDSFVDRLALTPERIAGIAADTRQVATLEDPIGHIEEMRTRPNGLQIGRMRVPLGVIGAVYESRPNVTVDIAALCLKSGNATVLRSGSDAHATSSALAAIVMRSIEAAGLPAGIVQFIDSTDRDEVGAMLKAHEYIDLMIPRGGADLIRRVRDEATMPVVAGGIGVCHTYIDASADLEMARRIVVNAKTRRPSICNALDTVLVHAAIADQLLPELSRELGERGVLLHTD